MIDSTIFIGTIIAGVTELLRTHPKINGAYTIVAALVVGIVVALLDTSIGIKDISVAQGILIALGAVGVVGTAKKIG